MKPFLFVVALILGVTNGNEEIDPYETNCSIPTVEMPPYYFDENCPHRKHLVDHGKIFGDILKPTYEKIIDSCDAVTSDICSQEFLKYSGGKHPKCKEDLKQLLCEDEDYILRVFSRHLCYYKKILTTIFEDEDKWENNGGDLCYILSYDVLCTTATTWICERIDNRFTRGYCNKRLGDVCKKIRDDAKKVVNPPPASAWTKLHRYW